MIIAALAGGMGNQMFIYAMGYALAQKRQTSLYLDTTYFENLPHLHTPRNFELGRFNITGRIMRRPQILWAVAGRAIPLAGWFGRFLRHLPTPQFTRIEDAQASFNPVAADAPDNSFLSGFWQTEKYFVHLRPQLLKEFSFKAPPTPENAEMIQRIKSRRSVCVHVRRTDFTKAYSMAQPISVHYYDKAIRIMSERTPGADFFVFSDDSPWAQQNIGWPAGTTFITHNQGKDDGEDLRLMSQCDHFIIANSTFSWWGAWLGTAGNKIVIGPKHWYPVTHPSETDLIPETWASRVNRLNLTARARIESPTWHSTA